MIRPKKNMCVSGRPTDPKILPLTLTFFMPKKKKKKKKIDQQNPEIRLRFCVCFRLQQFSSFPCTFGTKNIVLHVK